MPGSVLIEGGFEAGRKPRRSIFVGKITSRARHSSAAAIASVRAFPRAPWMVLAHPLGVRAEDAFHAKLPRMFGPSPHSAVHLSDPTATAGRGQAY
jgi:hypothetical protein